MPSVIEWYQIKRKGGKFVNLQKKLQNIKDEYMLYEYIDRSPRVVGERKELDAPVAAFKGMLDEIYKRKQLLSEILKASKNNTLEKREKEFSEQLLASDNYFSNISPAQMQANLAFFDRADEKGKAVPRYQSYQMIYKNLVKTLKLLKK